MSKVHKGLEWYGCDTTRTLCGQIVKDVKAADENEKVTCPDCLKKITGKETP